jgi:hypothetical protein
MRSIALLLLLLIAGCGDSAKDVVAKNKAAIQAQVSRLAALAGDVGSRAPVTADKLEVPGGLKLNFRFGEPGFNTVVAYPGFLEDSCDGKELHWFEEGRARSHETRVFAPPLDSAGAWLTPLTCILAKGEGEYPPKLEHIKLTLGYLAEVKFVLVPRLKFVRPVYEIDPDGKVRRFRSGTITGDVLLYDLASAKYLGGFTIAAQNEDTVKARKSDDLFNTLQINLIRQAGDAIKAKLAALAPQTVFLSRVWPSMPINGV